VFEVRRRHPRGLVVKGALLRRMLESRSSHLFLDVEVLVHDDVRLLCVSNRHLARSQLCRFLLRALLEGSFLRHQYLKFGVYFLWVVVVSLSLDVAAHSCDLCRFLDLAPCSLGDERLTEYLPWVLNRHGFLVFQMVSFAWVATS